MLLKPTQETIDNVLTEINAIIVGAKKAKKEQIEISAEYLLLLGFDIKGWNYGSTVELNGLNATLVKDEKAIKIWQEAIVRE